MTTPEAQAPCTVVAHYVATGTIQVRGNTVPAQSYCCLLLYTEMALLLCIIPAGWGLCILSLKADQCVGVEEQQNLHVDARGLMLGFHC